MLPSYSPSTAQVAEPLDLRDPPIVWSAGSACVLGALSLGVFLLHGYHPYGQDGSIYVAEIEKRVNGSLFHADASFIGAHAGFSVFSPVMAKLVHLLHVPLPYLLLAVYLLSIAGFLSASYLIASRLFRSPTARWGATLFAAACFTMPAAGTSLLLMDPYVTARSLSTPFSLFAILGCLDRSWWRVAVFSLLTIAVHPLMGIYLIGYLLVFALLDYQRTKAAIGVCAAGFALCVTIKFMELRVPVSAAYREAALSRNYYFLSGWHWYEIIGLIAPLLLMAFVGLMRSPSSLARTTCAACVFVGGTSLMASLCLVRANHPDLIMRLQVLRSFQIIYVLGVVLLGGFVFSSVWRWGRWMAVVVLLATGTAMFAGDLQSYPATAHIEWPGENSVNPGKQAFLWVRSNTPPGAVFAAAPEIFRQPGGASLGFRAIAQRSILTDTKDEGLASLFPDIAPEWSQRARAESGLNQASDQERVQRLEGYGVTWILLSPGARTSFPCPYRNAAVAVCKLIL